MFGFDQGGHDPVPPMKRLACQNRTQNGLKNECPTVARVDCQPQHAAGQASALETASVTVHARSETPSKNIRWLKVGEVVSQWPRG